MRIERLQSHLADEKLAPCYLVYGDESYFIEEVGHWFEHAVVPEEFRDFNQTVLYGADFNMTAVIERARQLPMMYERTLVVVRQAQGLMRQMNELESYVSQPNPQCVLVFLIHQSSIDRRKKAVKEIEKQEGLIACNKLYENEVPRWFDQELKSVNVRFEPSAKQLFLATVGNDPKRIKSELQKMILAESKAEQIQIEHIERYVGVHRTFNVFELQKALSQGRIDQAANILAYFSDNSKEHPVQMTLPVLFSYFNKVFKYHALKNKSEAAKVLGVSPYFMKDYENAAKVYSMKRLTRLLADLKSIDLQSKGVGYVGSSSMTAGFYQALTLALIP
jgi:DNA polymerase-3 subunit delta